MADGASGESVSYEAFIQAKRVEAPSMGFEPRPIFEVLFPFQRDIVRWACRRGRAAIFASFGLGKSLCQLEIARQVCTVTGGRFLICAPLGVRQEFQRDASLLGVGITFVRRLEECSETGIYLTNYETIRDGKLDPRAFAGISLDEAAILRGFGGTKTFRQMMTLFEGSDVRYRFVATATPCPNEYEELLAYSAFLEAMDIGQAKTRFFKRDSTKADCLTLHPHKEREFWLWMSTWALFVTKPSDVDASYSDEGYVLPELDVRWHELPTNHTVAGEERSGQVRLLREAAIGITDAAREKRESLGARIQKLLELRAEDPNAHRVIWHDLEAERKAIEAAIPSVRSVYGAQSDEDKEEAIIGFAEGSIQELAGKPVMLGAGVNFQRNCAWAVYLGIGFKFNDWIQSIHRLQRFLQTRKVRVDLIYTEAEREVRRALERKWTQHRELVARMTEIVREYGLTRSALEAGIQRSHTVERVEASGESWRLVNNDSVLEARRMEENSVGLILTSVPFSTQYEYSPSFLDFGHTDDNAHFWRQMDYLSPELLRVLQPGRIFACHVKDRIVPGGMTGLGFQTVYPFHADAIAHYTKHGFAFIGMVTITTDVVRENNQTYRLAYTEQCKDGSRQGVGMPEYLLLFRKPQTDRTRGYADVPVVKAKADYTLARWQLDAAGYHRSSGNRLLAPEELLSIPHAEIFKLWRRFNLATVYDYEHHVALNQSLEDRGRLPTDFSLMPPHSWHPDVWTDITRMRTLNGAQSAKGREMHLCPMQLDLAERAIRQYTMAGETVYDPFSGLGTVAMCAVKLGRRGLGSELSPRYHADAVGYCRAAERAAAVPTLFDLEAGEPGEDSSNAPAPQPLDAIAPIKVETADFGPMFATGERR